MTNYYKNKLDGNHHSLIADLEGHGVIVEQLMHPVDILGSYKGFTGFAELKIKGSAAKFTRMQIQWMSKTRFPVAIIHDIVEAMTYFASGKGLNDRDKYRLHQMLATDPKRKFFTPSEVEKALRI
jgi:hypothetical protein